VAASTQGLDDIEIYIAPGSSSAGDVTGFQWAHAGSRRTAADLVVTAGRDDEAAHVEAGSLSATMDDRDGDLSPRNVYGTWYGSLKRGTPVQVQWPRLTDSFTRTTSNGWGTADGGFAWSSSAPTAMSTDGTRALLQLASLAGAVNVLADAGSFDVDLVWSTTVPVLPTGGSLLIGGIVRYSDNSNYLRSHTEFQTAGTIAVKFQRKLDGVTSEPLALTATGLSYVAGDTFWTRVRVEGPTVMTRVWKDGTTEPTTWHGSATEMRLPGSGIGLFMSRLNTNAGTYTVYIDSFSVVNALWTGGVPDWPPRWPDKAGEIESVMPLSGAGIMRRLQQGSSPLISPLLRQLSGLSYGYAYFPLEDGAASDSAASGLSGGNPATVQGDVTFAGDDTLPGASTSLVLKDAAVSKLIGTIPTTAQTFLGGLSALLYFRCDQAVVTEQIILEIKVGSGAIDKWVVFVNATTMGWRGLDSNGNEALGASGLYGPDVVLTDWVGIRFRATGGSSQTIELTWNAVGSSAYFTVSDTLGGPSSFYSSFKVAAAGNSMSIGHLWFGTPDLPFHTEEFSLVSNGWIGELASDRIVRLCSETSTPVAVQNGDSEPMGRQRIASLMDLLRDCEQADQGTLWERGNALAYRPRSARYNAAVALALDWSLGHLAEPPEPADDDQRLRNSWTVTRTNGSSATVTDESGPLGVDAVGLYDDQIDVNVQYDFRLTDFASWLVHLGTSDELRWPRIKIDLVAHPELIPSWLACDIGSRVTIANPPTQIAGEVIDLIIEGYTQTINVDKWTVELSCSPARPWAVGTYGASASSGTARYDSPSTTLQSQVVAAGTTLVLTFAMPSEGWTTRSASFPLDLLIAGEQITVPAAANMGAITGAGPCTQTITGATRGVNGINKILPAGSEVHVSSPGRYAL
jgi:hypothetical protein